VGGDSFYLAYPTDSFVEAVRQLLAIGFRFITIEDIVHSRYEPGEKLVCFSFDDGFADNYTVLFPCLRYFNIPVSIFISGEFIAGEDRAVVIDPGSRWLRQFLSRAEICEMHESGLVDFQGHSMTHTWYPTSGRIVAVHPIERLDEYYWIYWNRFPERKAATTRQEMLELKCRTFAVFEHNRALNCRRFLPEKDEFSCQGASVGEVMPGRLETEVEQRQRYEYELIYGKQLLEKMLDKELCFLAWPGGALDALSYEVFCQAGYKACTVPSNPHKQQYAADIFKGEQAVIRRCGPASTWRGHDLGPAGLVRRVLQDHHFSFRLWAMEKGLRIFLSYRAAVTSLLGFHLSEPEGKDR